MKYVIVACQRIRKSTACQRIRKKIGAFYFSQTISKIVVHSISPGAQKPSKKGRARVNMMDLRPTYTHEALVKLTEMGHLKYLISQNTDGLHRLSGIPEGSIAELHGNAFTEKCERCEKRYTWNFGHRSGPKVASVPPRKCDHCRINHRTGRICPDAVWTLVRLKTSERTHPSICFSIDVK